MKEQEVSFEHVQGIIRRNRAAAVMIVCICSLLAYLLIPYIPKKFKAKAVLNIQAAYFQNAMVGDLVPAVTDTGEQNAQRLSLLRLALSEKFIDALGEKYSVFQHPRSDPRRAVEREGLLKRIEYFELNSTTYQISVISPQAGLAYDMTRDVLQQMIWTLVGERRKNLVRVKDAVEAHVAALNMGLKEAASPASSLRPEALREELARLTEQARVLKNQFSPMHPEVTRLEERARSVRRVLENSSSDDSAESEKRGLNPAAKTPLQEVYYELVKKLNYLNILVALESGQDESPYLVVIEHPSLPVAPFFPPVQVVLLIGVAAGLALAAGYVVAVELHRGTFLSPAHAAAVLGVSLLGELPKLTTGEQVRLLEGPGATAVRQLLPAPSREE